MTFQRLRLRSIFITTESSSEIMKTRRLTHDEATMDSPRKTTVIIFGKSDAELWEGQ